MLATTIQITNNPPHTTHTQEQTLRMVVRATTTNKAADAHTVLNVNPTVCLSAIKAFMPNPKHAPTPTTHNGQSTHAGTRKQPRTNQTGQHALVPQNWAP